MQEKGLFKLPKFFYLRIPGCPVARGRFAEFHFKNTFLGFLLYFQNVAQTQPAIDKVLAAG